jgi:hypothetical protein
MSGDASAFGNGPLVGVPFPHRIVPAGRRDDLNNITFVPGLGSFHLLVSYYSSLPCEDDCWLESQLVERCERCTACRRSCPTGAIPADRFALHQDRCITFYSGYSGPQELPGWLDPDWIECLIGCRRCQAALLPSRSLGLKWRCVARRSEAERKAQALVDSVHRGGGQGGDEVGEQPAVEGQDLGGVGDTVARQAAFCSFDQHVTGRVGKR